MLPGGQHSLRCWCWDRHAAGQLPAAATPQRPLRPPPRRRSAAAGPRARAAEAAAGGGRGEREPLERLAAWLAQRGGSVGAIGVGECDMGSGARVRGLVALEDLPAGAAVLSVPVGAALRDDEAGEAYRGAPWNANLAARLLRLGELAGEQRQAAPFGPYLETLPGGCDGPLLLEERGAAEVQYRPAADAIASYQAAARASHAAVRAAAEAEGRPPPSWERWAWATHMVQSRSIRLAVAGCKAMIPGIDLLNHGGAAANGQLVLGKASWQVDGEPAVVFVTTREVAAGEQVLWSYGSRSNDDFFVYHGFALGSNPDEDVVLFGGAAELASWAAERLPVLRAARGCAAAAAAAETAATKAVQEATARCSSAAIPGTSSSLLVPLPELLQRLRSGGAGAGAGGPEAAVLASLRGVVLHRRLASFRLHSPEWGTAACPSAAPELVLRADSRVDVRVPAVLAALAQAAVAAGTDVPGAQGASGAASAEGLAALLVEALHARCGELLAAFPTSAEDDAAWLERRGSGDGEGGGSEREGGCALMPVVVRYRLGKKRVLQEQLRQLQQELSLLGTQPQ